MDHTLVDEKSLKTLEDYAVYLLTGMLSLKTLHNQQVRALELGIMPEDMAERSNTLLWDLRRLIKGYKEQAEAVLELLPGDFTIEKVMETLKAREITKARSLIRKGKACDT